MGRYYCEVAPGRRYERCCERCGYYECRCERERCHRCGYFECRCERCAKCGKWECECAEYSSSPSVKLIVGPDQVTAIINYTARVEGLKYFGSDVLPTVGAFKAKNSATNIFPKAWVHVNQNCIEITISLPNKIGPDTYSADITYDPSNSQPPKTIGTVVLIIYT